MAAFSFSQTDPMFTSMITSPQAGVSLHRARQRSLLAQPCERVPLEPFVVASRARPRSLSTEPRRPSVTARRRGVRFQVLGLGDDLGAAEAFFIRVIGSKDNSET
jgi:hypothetical protein